MTITLTRDKETVAIQGDDEMIRDNGAYAGLFERQVKFVTERFYGTYEKMTVKP